jgi:hypothetical protein
VISISILATDKNRNRSTSNEVDRHFKRKHYEAWLNPAAPMTTRLTRGYAIGAWMMLDYYMMGTTPDDDESEQKSTLEI